MSGGHCDDGPGIFMCSCRGGITHYTLPSARCAPGDTRDPVCGFALPEVWASPPFLPPRLYPACGGKNTAHGAGTMDEGRGLLGLLR